MKQELYYYIIHSLRDLEIPPELAYYLVCARVNPALPPRARTIEHARSKIWTAVALSVAAHEATRAQLARVYISAGSGIIRALREVAPRAAAIAEEYTIGSWKRHKRDCGGHGALFLKALQRALLHDHPYEDFMQSVGMAFPRTVDAIYGALITATVSRRDEIPIRSSRINDAISAAIAAEWVIGDADTPASPDRKVQEDEQDCT